MLILLVLLFATSPTIVSSQSTPYSISFTARAAGGNILTLQCKGEHGTQVAGASFYRNGQNITNSSCLTSYPTSTSSELRIELVSQECDGFFSCGKDEILSNPEPLYACPIKNNSDRTVSTQEGDSVFLTCDFPLSPINRYHTTWIRNPGSLQVTVQNTSDLQGYTVNDPRETEYVCQIKPTNVCYNGDISHSGPFINIRLIERFAAPTITEDLDYTRNNNGDDVFSVMSRGTNLTHRWYKNGGLINSTGDSILEISNTSLRVKETDGSLRIAYVVSNVDYDNTSHSMRQTFGVYSDSRVSCEDSMKIAVPIMGTAICILTIICAILCFCVIYLWKTNKSAREENDNPNAGGIQSSEEDTCSCEVRVQGCTKCKYEQSMDPDERLSLYAIRIVKDCNTDSDFLESLQLFLIKAKNKKYNNKCRELCSRMISEVETAMQEIEPQEGDGTRGIGLDGSNEHLYDKIDDQDDRQHHCYKQYQDIRKVLQEIASSAD